MKDNRAKIHLISNAWLMACAAYPDQRAGQVFVNAVGDPFYLSCQDIIDRLDAYTMNGIEDNKVRKVAQAIADASSDDIASTLSERDLKAARAAIEAIEKEGIE